MEEPRRSTRSSHSDESLARKVALGDDVAFDELRGRYGRGLSQYAARLVGDLALGEDLARRALREARRALRSGTRPACVSPWLYRLTLTTALQARASGPGQRAAPGRLPEHQRQAFVLREVYGLSVPEIATELGMSAGDVQQAQFAARRRLAQVSAQRPATQTGATPAPSARRLSARPAALAVAAAAVALCVGMPVVATYGPDRHDTSTPALMTHHMAERAL